MIHILRLDRISELTKQTMIQVIKELKVKQHEIIRHLKQNPILATANWLLVQKAIDIELPPNNDKKEDLSQDKPAIRHYIDHIQCDQCHASVTIPISKFEFQQTFEDCRIRILR